MQAHHLLDDRKTQTASSSPATAVTLRPGLEEIDTLGQMAGIGERHAVLAYRPPYRILAGLQGI